jgi:hypothetical protein
MNRRILGFVGFFLPPMLCVPLRALQRKSSFNPNLRLKPFCGRCARCLGRPGYNLGMLLEVDTGLRDQSGFFAFQVHARFINCAIMKR